MEEPGPESRWSDTPVYTSPLPWAALFTVENREGVGRGNLLGQYLGKASLALKALARTCTPQGL